MIGLYFCKCGESYVSDVAFNVVNCLHCHSEIRREGTLNEQQLTGLTDAQYKHLRRAFTELPIDDKRKIQSDFLLWKAGASCSVIQNWFDKAQSSSTC